MSKNAQYLAGLVVGSLIVICSLYVPYRKEERRQRCLLALSGELMCMEFKKLPGQTWQEEERFQDDCLAPFETEIKEYCK